ncbi:MAG: NAD-dependent deacylase [Chloroflexota bacterium]|jgi:NAD-dependent deacetylase
MSSPSLEAAIRLLRRARYLVALTGAGISTRSGIPDFRSPHSGLWKQADPAQVASLHGFRRHPERFYAWIQPLAYTILDAAPNPAHLALARMERAGRLRSIITQNIDMLHERAGSRTVYEVHGHLREMTCIHCFAVFPAEPHIHTFIASGTIPYCPRCGHVLKPNVILLGEQLPARTLSAARCEVRRCDVLLAIGSSLEMYPAGELPVLAHRAGAALVFVNLRETALDSLADSVIRADVVDVLPQLADVLESET